MNVSLIARAGSLFPEMSLLSLKTSNALANYCLWFVQRQKNSQCEHYVHKCDENHASLSNIWTSPFILMYLFFLKVILRL